MINRRNFIKDLSALGVLGTLPHTSKLGVNQRLKNLNQKEKIWGLFLHLSYNMWEAYVSSDVPITESRGYRPYLRFSDKLWNDALERMAAVGMNMVVITLGDGVKYKSHPEIAVRDAWSTDRLREELKKIRKLGMEPIPELNFSAGHDTWLKQYSRMLSTDKYYEVCSDLIKEITALFDRPRFFHLGMDEETAGNQRNYDYVVVRQNELWWSDFYFLISEVEKNGARPWIWSDYVWHHPDLFYRNMPKSVLQSNWYYRADFDKKKTAVKAYLDLEKSGFDQIPTASNWGGGDWHSKDGQESIMNTVKFCSKNISDDHLLGFLQTIWSPTIEEKREKVLNSIDQVGAAKRWFEQNNR